tara:strand:+ start:98 stop:439 length:342 start_codon:yes stop_codon:yes gene_type:complete
MPASFENSSYSDPVKYREYLKNQRRKEKERIDKYIESLRKPCIFCGSPDDIEFHHINPLEKTKLIGKCRTKKAINAEIAKCWTLCKSCHTSLHLRLCDPLPSTYELRCECDTP